MAGSLRDQLMKQGLVDEKKVRQAKHQERQERTRARKAGKGSREPGPGESADPGADPGTGHDDGRARARAALAARAEADRARAKAAQAEQERQARLRRAAQIVASQAVERRRGDRAFHFVVERRVKQILVDRRQQDALARGSLRIVRDPAEDVAGPGAAPERWALVEAATAERLEGILPELVVPRPADHLAEAEAAYADHPIPDDLDW